MKETGKPLAVLETFGLGTQIITQRETGGKVSGAGSGDGEV